MDVEAAGTSGCVVPMGDVGDSSAEAMALSQIYKGSKDSNNEF